MRTLYTTSTRRAIVDLLKGERRYLTASFIYRRLKVRSPKLALSTVYRTMELLAELGTVSTRTEPGGETAFVYCRDEHHHHAICRRCGHVDDVDCDALDLFKTALLAKQSFALDDHSIEFFGLCASCR